MIRGHFSRCRWHASFEKFQLGFHEHLEIGLAGNPVPADCLFTKQVHGITIMETDRTSHDRFAANRPEADGIWTRQTELRIGVKTADCLPVVLYSQPCDFIAVLHAGWRGLTSGIIQEGVAAAAAAGHSPDKIGAFFGPCISPAKFEIGPEVADAFSGRALGLTDAQLGYCLSKGIDKKWHGDLAMAGVSVLLNCGIIPDHIDVLRECTFSSKNNWASFRRDGRTGDNIWTWARLKK
jgi:YfiH family protein